MENQRDKCPCCGYLTLPRRLHPQMPQWDICILCNWEDDGQTDQDADRIYGGPNAKYSLTEARTNFKKYLVMYSPNNAKRITKGDWPKELTIKQSLIKLFEEVGMSNDKNNKDKIWSEITKLENKLNEFKHLKIEQFFKKQAERSTE